MQMPEGPRVEGHSALARIYLRDSAEKLHVHVVICDHPSAIKATLGPPASSLQPQAQLRPLVSCISVHRPREPPRSLAASR